MFLERCYKIKINLTFRGLKFFRLNHLKNKVFLETLALQVN